jgi:hypothetical protein
MKIIKDNIDLLFEEDEQSQEEKDFINFEFRRFIRKDNRKSMIQNLFKDEFDWHKEPGAMHYDYLWRVERKKQK